MRVITGDKLNTSFGVMLIHNEQTELFSVGEQIMFDNTIYKIEAVIPPTKPNGKWALRII